LVEVLLGQALTLVGDALDDRAGDSVAVVDEVDDGHLRGIDRQVPDDQRGRALGGPPATEDEDPTGQGRPERSADGARRATSSASRSRTWAATYSDCQS